MAASREVDPILWWLLGGAGILLLVSRREEVSDVANQLLTLDRLRRAMPNLPLSRATKMSGPLSEAMREAQIDTPLRMAAFLAQVGHESYDFRYMEEVWGPTEAQRRYEGRVDLGNTQAGDGYRYRGRGPVQLTGRANYRAFTREVGSRFGVDLEANPDLVAEPLWGFRAAAWYWTSRDLNELADIGEFDEITRRINGGFNGKEDRDKRYRIAKAALLAAPDVA